MGYNQPTPTPGGEEQHDQIFMLKGLLSMQHWEETPEGINGSRETCDNTISIIKLRWYGNSADGKK